MSRGFRLAASIVAVFTIVTIETGAESSPVEKRVLFYLHGKIVEDQGPDAESARYGRYEYHAIVKALGRRGHEVRSETREPGTVPAEYAEKIAQQIRSLQLGGVPSQNLTVVGASKGAAIAVLVSHLLQDPEVRYVLLGICGPKMLEYWETRDICVTGHVLSVYEASDVLAQSCEALATRCASGIPRFDEIELNLGLGHGVLYRPLEPWLDPTLEWSTGQAPAP